MWTEHPVEPRLLARLWAHLWPRGLEEFARLGLTQEQALWRFLCMAERSDDARILCLDGEPVLVIGTVLDDGEWCSFFQATSAFEKHGRQITKRVRRWLRDTPHPVTIYSVLVHPEAARWFCALGFAQDEWQGKTEAGVPLFRFRRRVDFG
jgi:hypothetical protein